MRGRRRSPLLRSGSSRAATARRADGQMPCDDAWAGDQPIVISAFWDAALQAKQLELAQ